MTEARSVDFDGRTVDASPNPSTQTPNYYPGGRVVAEGARRLVFGAVVEARAHRWCLGRWLGTAVHLVVLRMSGVPHGVADMAGGDMAGGDYGDYGDQNYGDQGGDYGDGGYGGGGFDGGGFGDFGDFLTLELLAGVGLDAWACRPA